MPNKYYLQASSPLGQKIHITKSYWNYITTRKHPSVAGAKSFVLQTIAKPDTIKSSQKDPSVWLFYKKFKSIYLCVVVKILNSKGFIITIYFTNQIKRGRIVWQK
jgi:hypothetical protein